MAPTSFIRPKKGELHVFSSMSEVEGLVSREGLNLVVRNGYVYDIKHFLEVVKHPGGKSIVEREMGTDIGTKMENFEHSDTAYDMLELYKVGYIEGMISGEVSAIRANSQRAKNLGYSPDDLKSALSKLDLSRGLVSQIWEYKLTPQEYLAFTNDPKILDSSALLYDNPVMESLTKTQLEYVIMFWSTVIISLLIGAYSSKVGIGIQALAFMFGCFVWTLIEYILHRYIFHKLEEDSNKGRVWRTIHFLFHGSHHAYPQDRERVAFPIMANCMVTTIIFVTVFGLFGFPRCSFIILAGGLSGYLFYDIVHNAIHHSKSENFYMRWIKKHHLKHHFRHPNSLYGVTSTLWDHVFGTLV